MAKKSKRYQANIEKVEEEKVYSLADACQLASETGNCKFDESVDLAIRLGVDPKKADQNVRGSVSLPHGLGKDIKVAVFAKGEKAQEAKDAGADIVGADDLVEEVKQGNLNFDSVIATPDMMGQVGKVGKILGPRNLMPSPKSGTVTNDVGDTVKAVKAGMATYKVDKVGDVHVSIGKASFGGEKITENAEALLAAINRAKPQSSKGIYLKSGSISTTMGPGIKLDLASLR